MPGTPWKDLENILFKLDQIITLLQQIKANQDKGQGNT